MALSFKFTFAWTVGLILLLDSGTAMPIDESSSPFELKHSIQDTTTGAVKLQCQARSSLKMLNVTDSNVVFWLSRKNATDAGLRERDDVKVTETEDQLGIVFNLTRDLEGYYTCGRRIDSSNVSESPSVTLISHQRVIPLPEMFVSTFTATPGDTATLRCPIQPGQLGQYYSVRWKKGYAVVAALISSSTPTDTAPRHSIDRTDSSLIIEDVQLSDASSSYKCEVFVRDPLSHGGETNTRLTTVPEVLITLQVSEHEVIPSIAAVVNTGPIENDSEAKASPSCSCTCQCTSTVTTITV